MSSRDSELLNAIKTLNANLITLNTTLSSMNSKIGNPENTDEALIGASATYFMVLNGTETGFDASSINTVVGGVKDAKDIIYIGNSTYLFISGDLAEGEGLPYKTIYQIKSDGSACTKWATVAEEIDALTLIDDGTYYVAALTNTSVGGKWVVYLFNDGGTLLKTVSFDYTGADPEAICYDNANEQILLYSTVGNGFYSLDIGSQTITKEYVVPNLYYAVASTNFISGLPLILITTDTNEGAGDKLAWYIFDIEKKLIIASGYYTMITKETTTLETFYCTYNSDLDTIVLWSGEMHDLGGGDYECYIYHFGLAFAQLTNIVGPNAYGSVAINDAGDSITVDGTVAVSSSALPSGAATEAKQDTMITSLQLIDDLKTALNSVGTDDFIVEQLLANNFNAYNITVDDTIDNALDFIATNRTDRRALIIQNADNSNTVWIGGTHLMTISGGLELLPKQVIVFDNYQGNMNNIYGICDTGKTANIRVGEVW
jgi:hypothetical protein